MRTVLFVCTANVCRSPMSEAIFNALAEDSGLPSRARSAGLAAPEGAPVSARAADALAEMGIDTDPHCAARQVDESMVAGADVVLAMTPQQTAELRRLFGPAEGKIHTLAEYVGGSPNAGVADPTGHARSAYRASAHQLLGYLEILVSRVGKEEQTGFGGPIPTGEAGRAKRDPRSSDGLEPGRDARSRAPGRSPQGG